jgi:3-hydroxyacyl-CoA dehydrogenase/enoyl-CoA hydratase/3-hydroxybutyryl-CoA epimerase
LRRDNPDENAVVEAADRWQSTMKWDGFADADAVIEAIFELPELKVEMLAMISNLVSPNALIATNTSAIPIHSLASAVKKPERFIGTHFFSPVDRMPFLELVPHNATAPEAVSRAAVLAGQLGKRHIVVADKPGFFTSRVYARWLMEGIRLLLDGVTTDVIDSAAIAMGFPVGPLHAHDEATLDLVMKASIMQVAQNVMTDRLDVGAVQSALEKLLAAGILGRRQGNGFYLYENGHRGGTNPDVANVLDVTSSPLSPLQVGDRMVLAFATECFLCWDDGTLCHPDDGDVASVLAIGFPRNLGGPFHWVDEIGTTNVLAQCITYGAQAFPPGATLSELARTGKKFHDVTRREFPEKTGKTTKT